MMSIFDQGARLVPDIVTEAEEQRILLRIADATWLTDLSRRVQHYGYRYAYRGQSRDRNHGERERHATAGEPEFSCHGDTPDRGFVSNDPLYLILGNIRSVHAGIANRV